MFQQALTPTALASSEVEQARRGPTILSVLPTSIESSPTGPSPTPLPSIATQQASSHHNHRARSNMPLANSITIDRGQTGLFTHVTTIDRVPTDLFSRCTTIGHGPTGLIERCPTASSATPFPSRAVQQASTPLLSLQVQSNRPHFPLHYHRARSNWPVAHSTTYDRVPTCPIAQLTSFERSPTGLVAYSITIERSPSDITHFTTIERGPPSEFQ